VHSSKDLLTKALFIVNEVEPSDPSNNNNDDDTGNAAR